MVAKAYLIASNGNYDGCVEFLKKHGFSLSVSVGATLAAQDRIKLEESEKNPPRRRASPC